MAYTTAAQGRATIMSNIECCLTNTVDTATTAENIQMAITATGRRRSRGHRQAAKDTAAEPIT